jgi:hypothetical protein
VNSRRVAHIDKGHTLTVGGSAYRCGKTLAMERALASTEPPPVRSLSAIAEDIRTHWPEPKGSGNKLTSWKYAQPYVKAMSKLEKLTDVYVCETGRDMVTGFLVNAMTWRGEDAQRIKDELKAMLRSDGGAP